MVIRLLSIVVASTLFSFGCSDSDSITSEEIIIEVPQVDIAVESFMAQYNVPGISVAITKEGRLVFAKGYGFADVDAEVEVTNSSLFRIASVSKPVTGIGIMLLAEEGLLSLDDKVFGEEGILGTQYGTSVYSTGLTNITVRHLLNHTAGGWPNDETDPMFLNADADIDELISWTIENRPLTHEPGLHYNYSNFGYALLGKIIEARTNHSFEDFLETAISLQTGALSLQVGGSTRAERKPDEVVYYGRGNQDPYIYNIPRLAPVGGLISSAADLARLLVSVDGFDTTPPILSDAGIHEMTSPSSANSNYASGWAVNTANHWWHVGSLPGTAAIMVRTSSGYNWVVLCNTRSTNDSFFEDLDGLIWQAVNNPATQWPDVDLF